MEFHFTELHIYEKLYSQILRFFLNPETQIILNACPGNLVFTVYIYTSSGAVVTAAD